MSSRHERFGFLFCAVCLHMAMLWPLLQQGPFKDGAASGISRFEKPSPALVIDVVAGKVAQLPLQSGGMVPVSGSDFPVDKVTRQVSIKSIESTDTEIDQLLSAATQELTIPLKFNSDTADIPDQEYFSVGHLTRLPAPVADIDLNDVYAADDIVIAGSIDLTLLIDTNGVVADVITLTETKDTASFLDRVAERFKSARFTPGEINGTAVNSQLLITVVSENTSTLKN